MSQPTTAGAATAIAPVQPRPCPLCGKIVLPDTLGLLECSCGWGDEGDPLEAAHGFSRILTLWDRRWANGITRRDLGRLARQRDKAPRLSLPYLLLLLLLGTAIYLTVLGLLAGSVALMVYFAQDGAWLGVVIAGLAALLLVLSLLQGRAPNPKGVIATRTRFPQFYSALDDVSARTGIRLPRRIIIAPGAEFFIFQRHPLRRFFLPEGVLVIGAAALPMLTQAEMQTIVAHELGHARRGGTALHRYYGGAEAALRHIVEVVAEGAQTERNAYGRIKRFWYIGAHP